PNSRQVQPILCALSHTLHAISSIHPSGSRVHRNPSVLTCISVPMLLLYGTDPEHIRIPFFSLAFQLSLAIPANVKLTLYYHVRIWFGLVCTHIISAESKLYATLGLCEIEFGRDMPEDRSLDPRVVLYLGVITGYIIPRSGTFHVRAIHHLFYDVDIAPASARVPVRVSPPFITGANSPAQRYPPEIIGSQWLFLQRAASDFRWLPPDIPAQLYPLETIASQWHFPHRIASDFQWLPPDIFIGAQ
ncbi:hypothetical protein B0H11DRAFT_2370390, partial [Mycena galericulata]